MTTSQVYPLVDPAALVEKIKAAGGPQLDPTEATGQATADGVTLEWVIADGKIMVTLLKRPWFVSEFTVWSHVNKILGDPV